MPYLLKRIYYTFQGEGFHAGRPAVFARFAGCNLWTGREDDRAAASCRFCDTDFVGTEPDGGRFETPQDLADRIATCHPAPHAALPRPFVVLTGGEPALQTDSALVDALHDRNFEIAIETNGTRPLPPGIDWVTVSPKAGSDLVVTKGNSLKLVYPQEGLEPADLEHLRFEHFYLQPMDGPDAEANTRRTIEYCLANPRWKVSLQTHKFAGYD